MLSSLENFCLSKWTIVPVLSVSPITLGQPQHDHDGILVMNFSVFCEREHPTELKEHFYNGWNPILWRPLDTFVTATAEFTSA